MRVMIKASLDTDQSNEVFRSGKMPELMGEILDRIQPEAAYFGPHGGCRTCFLVCDMQDSSELPPKLEPLFDRLGADVEVFPVMNRDDLQKGISQLR
ncbi:hypothetical protein [Streptomyces sp. NPDC006610]|jgi:hypothetical protein|uniref:hypothetical protein n=1 Tax=Streptomyces sp. NPDC006610 TaxID=3154584 RepID=UPI0033BBA384